MGLQTCVVLFISRIQHGHQKKTGNRNVQQSKKKKHQKNFGLRWCTAAYKEYDHTKVVRYNIDGTDGIYENLISALQHKLFQWLWWKSDWIH